MNDSTSRGGVSLRTPSGATSNDPGSPVKAALEAGARLGPFEIVGELGAGGMGEVYRARDTRLGRQVALKVLPRELMNNREGLARFALEARSASALNHPNIVTLFEIGELQAAPYMAMELVDGWTLRHLIDAGPLPVKKTLELGVQIASGLAKAHQAGIVHRDLKPENVMVTPDGFVKILDFGLAKLLDPQHSVADANPTLTSAGFVMGTPDYMSPEQAAARPLDFRSDQFAIGLIFYEMLTRRRAFHRATPVQTLSAIIQEEAEPLEKLNPRIPPPLRWVIERCLAKDADDRYPSTRELARELKQIRDHLGDFSDSGTRRTSHLEIRTDALDWAARSVPSAPAPSAAGTSGAPVPGSASATAMATATTRTKTAKPKPTAVRRVMDFVAFLLLGLALFGAGAAAGNWYRDRQTDPPPPMWKANLLAGPMTRVIAPRISPDGQTLAFVTVSSGRSHVAVMKPSSGDWTVLTRDGNPGSVGSVHKVAWTRDGNRLLFDRVADTTRGIFAVPPIGGEERLVLEDAESPEPLPDGSVLVVRRDAVRNFQLHRFWSDSGKVVPVGPAVVAESAMWSVRAFPDGKRAVFWGRLAGQADEARRVFLLDLETGKAVPFAPQLPLAPPLSVSADGSAVLAVVTFGDLQQAISVSRDGEAGRLLFPVTGKAWSFDAGRDGSLYLSTIDNPAELLKIAPTGGPPDRVASISGSLLTSPVQLTDGGVLLPSQVLGRRRLLIAAPTGEVRSFLDASEQATPPAALVGNDRLAFLSGPVGKPPALTIATVPEGRIVRRLEGTGVSVQSVVASPDGQTLYYVDAGSLFSVPTSGGAPKKLRAANSVALDARMPTPSLIVQVHEADGVRLYRIPLAGGAQEPILFMGNLRLAPAALSSNAVAPDGRIAVTVVSADSWFRGIGILDPVTASLERVPVAFDGDVQSPAWARDGSGSLLGMGVSVRANLWQFQPRDAGPTKGSIAP